MKKPKTYRLNVYYFGKKILFLIKRFTQKNGTAIYDLQGSAIHYVIINNDEDWTFIADFTPCADLKLAIISKLRRLVESKGRPLKPSRQLALVPCEEYSYKG